MNGKKCTNCSEKKLVTITISEAAWDRNEDRHRKEKRLLVIALIISLIISASNFIYTISKCNARDIPEESVADSAFTEKNIPFA